MIKFFQKNKKIRNILFVFLFVAVFLGIGDICYAGWNIENVTITIVGWIITLLVNVCGLILTSIVDVIVKISKYNNFIHEAAIIEAWKIIRDFCNMFFILILLVIAFATILRIESYNMKKWLPKLLLMAVLINFSRMVCGVLIDVSQLFFLTFVSTFRDNGADFIAVAQVNSYLKVTTAEVASETMKGIPFSNVVVGMVLGLIFLIISTVVLSAILLVIVMRVVMFWIYTTLSPLAFLLSSFPGGQKYASQYWGEFIKYLLNGPVLAFFVWLALVAGNGAAGIEKMSLAPPNASIEIDRSINILDTKLFLPFLMSIGMLVGGLMVSAQIGGMGSSWGQGMVGKLKGAAKAGAGKFSGYNYARDVGKNYMATRKSARDDRVRLTSEKVTGAIGSLKKNTIGYVGNKVSSTFNDKVWGRFGKNNAERIEKEILNKKEQFSEYQDNIKNKKSFDYKDKDNNFLYRYSHDGTNWKKNDGFRAAETIKEDDLYNNLESDFDGIINDKREEAKKYKDNQAKADRIAKYGMGAAGAAIAGGVTLMGGGGLIAGGLSSVAGFTAGKWGTPKVASTIKNAGKQDLGAASNYNIKQINDKKDKMKDDSNEKVLNAMNDMTKSSYERVAAAMEAMTRKIVDLNDVKHQSAAIREVFKGDKKVNGQLDSILEKNYVGATSTFSDLKNTEDLEKQAKAHRNVRAGYEDGTYSIKNMDAKTIKTSITEAALGVSTASFVKQFKDFDSSKQASVLRSLKSVEGVGEYEAKEKIAHIKDVNIAFGEDKIMKDKFIGKLSAIDLKKIIEEGNKDKLQALKDAVNDISQLSLSAQTAINGDSPTGKTIKDGLKI